MKSIGIIGGGSVGTAFGTLLHNYGYPITGVTCRNPRSADRAAHMIGCPTLTLSAIASGSDIVMITTPDRIITEVTQQLVAQACIRPETIVIHASGVHSAEILAPLRPFGAYVASLHPLQSCPTPERAITNLPGSIFSVQGDTLALPTIKKLAEHMGGQVFEITHSQKPLYHAAACVASNYFVSIIDLAVKLLTTAGIPHEQALPALLPLIKGSLANMETNGVPSALTGPIERGDASTITAHVQALEQLTPHLLAYYQWIGHYTVQVALDKNSLNANQAKQLLATLKSGSIASQATTAGG